MTIDRRTFLMGGGVAVAGGVLAAARSIAAVAQVEGVELPAMIATIAGGGLALDLRILGWDPGETNIHPTPPAHDDASWIAIDSQWRASWH